MKLRKEARGLKSRGFSPDLHYFKYAVKRYSWLALVSLIVMAKHTWQDAINGYKVEIGNLSEWTRMEYRVIGHYSNVQDRIHYASAFIAVFFAIVLFSFLWRKKESFSTLALGVSLKNQFLIRYLYGAGMLTLTYAASFIPSYFITIQRLGGDMFGLCSRYTFNYALTFTAVALAVYTLAVLAAILSGRFIDFLVSCGSLLAAPYAIGLLLKHVFGNFLHGSGLAHVGTEYVAHNSPWGKIFNSITDYTDKLGAFTSFGEFYSRSVTANCTEDFYKTFTSGGQIALEKRLTAIPARGFVITLALTLLFAFLACLFFIKRPAEKSGKAGAYPAFYVICAAIASLGGAAFVFTLPLNRFLLLLLYCIAASLAFFLLTVIYEANVKKFFLHYKSALCSIGAVCLCILICILGGFGFSGYLPEAEEIDFVLIDYFGNPAMYHGTNGAVATRGGDMSYQVIDGKVIFSSGNVNSITSLSWATELDDLPAFTDRDDIETILGIHQSVIDSGMKTRGDCGFDPNDPSSSVIRADWHIVYQLKNGVRVERYYPYVTLRTAEVISGIETSNNLRDLYISKRVDHSESVWNDFDMTEKVFQAADEFFADIVPLDMLTLDEEYELLEALACDFADLSFEDRYFSSDKTLGILRFAAEYRSDQDGSYSSRRITPEQADGATWYITEKYTRTLDFLEKKGLMHAFGGKMTVTSVEIQEFDPYACGENPSGQGAFLVISSYDNLLHSPKYSKATAVPESEWADYIGRSRAIAGTTRGGTLVRIKYTNSSDEEKVIDRLIPNE